MSSTMSLVWRGVVAAGGFVAGEVASSTLASTSPPVIDGVRLACSARDSASSARPGSHRRYASSCSETTVASERPGPGRKGSPAARRGLLRRRLRNGVALRAGAVTFPAAFGAVGGFAAFGRVPASRPWPPSLSPSSSGATRRRSLASRRRASRGGCLLRRGFPGGLLLLGRRLAAAFFGDAFAAALRQNLIGSTPFSCGLWPFFGETFRCG